MLTTITKLREIRQCCVCEKPLASEHMHWLAESLDAFLSHRCRSLDEAVGLKFGRGGVPWWLEEAMRKRDAALRELARQYLADCSVSAQATRIRFMSARYAASAWQQDKNHCAMPTRYISTEAECLW